MYIICKTDVFNDFIGNKEGKSHWNVSEDIKGLMELYEAAQLSVEGENVLDEAGNFSANLLNELMKNQLDHCQARVVGNTLSYPHHKSLPRFTAKTLFLNNYQGENGWIHVLRELATMEFNMVKSLHQKEVVQVSKYDPDHIYTGHDSQFNVHICFSRFSHFDMFVCHIIDGGKILA